MKKRTTYSTIILLSLIALVLVLTQCKQDDLQPISYPRLETLAVSDISELGATFHAKFISRGTKTISEYGFLWRDANYLSYELSERKTFVGSPGTDTYSVQIPTTLRANKTYYVCAYVRVEDKYIYGPTVTFYSLGSQAPVLFGVIPNHANIGDTVAVFGANLSNRAYNELAYLNEEAMGIISTTEDTIKVRIPFRITQKVSSIKIEVAGNSASLENVFTINPPKITSFEPKEVIANQEVRIHGENFGYAPAKVYFGEIEAEVKEVRITTIIALFPQLYEPQEYNIRVSVFDEQAISSEKIFFNPIYIEDFTPKSGTWGTEVTLKIQNFSKDFNPTLYFDGIAANIVSFTDTSLIATIPSNADLNSAVFKLTANNQSIESKDIFTMEPTEILSFTPESGSPGSIVKISGKNFHPTVSYNVVSFLKSSRTVDVLDASETELTVQLPYYFSYNDNFKLKIGNRILTSEPFAFIAPEIYSLSEEVVSYNSIVQIKGKGFSPSMGYTGIRINNIGCTVTSTSDSVISFRIPANINKEVSKITLNVGPTTLESNDELHFVWHQNFKPKTTSSDLKIEHAGFQIGDYFYFGFGHQMDGWYPDFFKVDLNNWTTTALKMLDNWDYTKGGISFAYNGKGYHGLGARSSSYGFSDKMREYDPATDTWMVTSLHPAGGSYLAVSFQVGSYVFVGTGYTPNGLTKEFWKYDINRRTWTQVADLPGVKRSAAMSFIYNNQGYVGFGKDENGQMLNDLYKYDAQTNQWTSVSTSNAPKIAGHTVLVFNNAVYFAGGVNDKGSNEVYQLDLSSFSFRQLATFGGGIVSKGFGIVHNSNAYIMSGQFYQYHPELEQNNP